MADEVTLEGAKWYISFILMLFLMTGAALWFKITEITPYKQSVNMILEREGGFTADAQQALRTVDDDYRHQFEFSYMLVSSDSTDKERDYDKYVIKAVPNVDKSGWHHELWVYSGRINVDTEKTRDEHLSKKYNYEDSSDLASINNLPVTQKVMRFGDKITYQVNVSLNAFFLRGFIKDTKFTVPINGYVYSRSRDANV